MLGTLTKGFARGRCWLSALLTLVKGFKPAEEGTGFGARTQTRSGSLGRLRSFLAKPASGFSWWSCCFAWLPKANNTLRCQDPRLEQKEIKWNKKRDHYTSENIRRDLTPNSRPDSLLSAARGGGGVPPWQSAQAGVRVRPLLGFSLCLHTIPFCQCLSVSKFLGGRTLVTLEQGPT